jgi:segregation and condensation protein B
MSLKAKIEAVIYAAEEPVTLAQLAAIFAAEVPASEPAPADHELTTLNDAGTMSDIDTTEAGAPRIASETWDVAPAAVSFVGESALSTRPGSEMGSDNPEVDAKRTTRQRGNEVREHLRELIEELISDYADGNGGNDRGIEIREIAGGYRMATKPEYHDAVRAFVKNLKPALKLSQQALETLAVIAYKQPVTSPEIGEIRGVDSGGVLATLISRKLVTTAGRKQVIGRPILYKTTKEFLLGFGLKDLSELPSMEEFEKMAGELAESDAFEEQAMNHNDENAPSSTHSEGVGDAETGFHSTELATEDVPQEQES